MDHDWYLHILVWAPSAAFLGGLIFTLWTGRLYGRGPIFSRSEQPRNYWAGVTFLVVCLTVATYGAATGFTP